MEIKPFINDNKNTNLPKVSFAFPVLNEEQSIERCLQSIRNQNYPAELLEIILADGGSTDKTIELAKKYNCIVINNPKKLAEPGGFLAHQKATGDIKVFFAADNALPHKNWIQEMAAPFIHDPDIYGAYTHIVPAPQDNSFNRYYSLLHVEPFTWFIYGQASHPGKFKNIYKISEKNENYIVFNLSVMNHPLLAFAQGFCIRREFSRKKEYEHDDILPVIQMIGEGYKLAYVPTAGIYHYHLKGYMQYLKKFQSRIRNSLINKNAGFDIRYIYLSRLRKFKKYLWLLYGVTIIGPVFDSIRWYMRDNEKCWFWHMPASISLSYLIVYEAIMSMIIKKV